MKLILLALCFAPCAAGCKHATSSSSTQHTETSTTTDTTSSESGSQTTVTTTSEAPSTTTTTVREYAPPEKEAAPEEVASEQDRSPGGATPPGQSSTPKLPRRGPLVKETVTVTQRGAETTETHQQAVTQGTAATETKAAGKSDVTAKATDKGGPSAGCIGASWLWGLAALAFAVLLIFGAIRMRRAVP